MSGCGPRVVGALMRSSDGRLATTTILTSRLTRDAAASNARSRRSQASDTRAASTISQLGSWSMRRAEEPPFTEAERQLRIRTRASAALADVYCAAGFVPVIDDIYVSRGRLDVLVGSLTARPVRLVVLAPDPSAALARDAARPDKTVGERWIHLDAVQREELDGIGLWIDSSELTASETVDFILDRLDDALLAPEAAP